MIRVGVLRTTFSAHFFFHAATTHCVRDSFSLPLCWLPRWIQSDAFCLTILVWFSVSIFWFPYSRVLRFVFQETLSICVFLWILNVIQYSGWRDARATCNKIFMWTSQNFAMFFPAHFSSLPSSLKIEVITTMAHSFSVFPRARRVTTEPKRLQKAAIFSRIRSSVYMALEDSGNTSQKKIEKSVNRETIKTRRKLWQQRERREEKIYRQKGLVKFNLLRCIYATATPHAPTNIVVCVVCQKKRVENWREFFMLFKNWNFLCSCDEQIYRQRDNVTVVVWLEFLV